MHADIDMCQLSQEKTKFPIPFAIQKSKRADSQAKQIDEKVLTQRKCNPRTFVCYEIDPELTRCVAYQYTKFNQRQHLS